MDIALYTTPLKMGITGTQLNINGKDHQSSVRTIAQMREVLLEQNLFSNESLYYMFRSVQHNETLRYDVTLIQPTMLKSEFAKTYGHYHPKAGRGIEYPEVYHVLHGDAKFILQKRNSDESVDVIIVSASKGDCILFPPGYGHVSANASDHAPLVLANVVSDNFKSDYSDYKKYRGAAVYYTNHGLVQNTNYIVRKVEHFTSVDINNRYGFMCSDLLTEFLKNPKKFEFLDKPELMFK